MEQMLRSAGPLTELADRYGSDKGSLKHRYTELYDLLFLPFRDRPITFLEMGLLIGGPEHGQAASRETHDAPSIRMWMEYFRKAQIIGLDISDFSWFEHERFRAIQCDMDNREELARAGETIGHFDIAIDDASHASQHQQYAFLELFPRMVSGGIYIIEDLRWQPATYEKRGFTKTAALMSGFSANRRFTHSDKGLEDQFNALGPQISGCFIFQACYDKARRDQLAVIQKV